MVKKINKIQKARKSKKRELDQNFEQFTKEKFFLDKELKHDNDLKGIHHTRASSN